MTIQKERMETPLVDERLLDSGAPANGELTARQQAIKQIERRRHFRIGAITSGIAMAFLVLIWTLSEYHNAGGWPTQGFSQSSGIHNVWNYWIVYPVGAWVLILSAHAWSVLGHKPVSEREIQSEIDRQAHVH